MHVHVILNQDGGTLRTTDLDLLTGFIQDEFRLHGHTVEVERVAGDAVVASIRKAADQTGLDVLVVGGGDGTVSAAAAALAGRKTALGILPAGTMNLFARTLQIPLAVNEAVSALAGGRITSVDLASVNGEPFVHQFSVGLHARMVRMRNRMSYGSRIGKMWATTRAIATAVRSLPLVRLDVEIDGRTERFETPAVAVSNNIYGPGHMPYADDPAGGQLGIYICRTTNSVATAKLALDLARGAWRDNPSITVLTAKHIRIEHAGRKAENRAVRDGELVDLREVSDLKIMERGLNALVPADATFLTRDGASGTAG